MRRSSLVSVVVRGLSTQFWAPTVAAVQQVLAGAGYHVVFSLGASAREQEEYGRVLMQIGVDGLLLLGDLAGDDELVGEWAAQRPVVGIC